MGIIESIVLGAVQGLTEFIPISSSGHLVIAQHLFSGASDHKFLEFINIGTLVALLVYFRKRIVTILGDIFKRHNYKLAINIVLTAVPAGLVGLALSDFIDSSPFFGSLLTVAVTLAVVGIVMIVLERLPKATQLDSIDELKPSRALIIGLAQMFALIPGVSRSGSTIIAGRLSGLTARDAAEYSFLASLPIMVAVTLKLFVSSDDRRYLMDNLGTLAVGNFVAFVTGLLAVGFLLKYLSKHGLALFGWYRVGLASLLILIFIIGAVLQ